MTQSYWMVGLNIVLVLLLLLGISVYRYVYPKNKIHLFFLASIISLLPVISIFRNGVYQSGDFTIQIYNAMSFYDSLKDGILIPSWASDLNGFYGYPLYLFIYIIPYYLIAFFHFLGLSFVLSEKIVLAVSYIVSGIMMYLGIRKLIKNELAAFVGDMIYLFGPYHLVDLHFRVALAETIAYAISATLFYFLLCLYEKPKVIYFVWVSLLLGILFLTHPPMFIFYSGIFIAFGIYHVYILKRYSQVSFMYFILAEVVGACICSFAILSRLKLTQFTYGSKLINTPVSYVSIPEILYSPWRWGFLFQGNKGELAFLLGYTQLFVLILGIFFLFKKYKTKGKYYFEILFWTGIVCAMILLMLPQSKIIWDMFPLLRLMQFAYRLLHPLIFSLAILAAYLTVVYQKEKISIYIFVCITILYTILNWGNRAMIPLDDVWLRNELPSTTREVQGMFEAYPSWYDPKGFSYFPYNAKQSIEIIKGQGEIHVITHTSIHHHYAIYASTPITVIDNTFYFPDWRVQRNGKSVAIAYKTNEYPGRIVFSLPKGFHFVTVEYLDIPIIIMAKKMSLIIVGILTSYIAGYYMQIIRRKGLQLFSQSPILKKNIDKKNT